MVPIYDLINVVRKEMINTLVCSLHTAAEIYNTLK
ncbi:MAG: hypothetical protein G01um101438_613 [Parcubacteria group bacterium Gr01-1014_38]|nr:MAG: hypothetical protein G01um101438_613 [Parcubacteria group bacterium Gr01-1014_38]